MFGSEWHLERFAYTPNGTFGKLYTQNYELFAVERPWVNNKPYESCIPIGKYHLEEYFSPRRQTGVLLLNNDRLLAKGEANGKTRTYIEIHPANKASELAGCIAPGERLGKYWNVLNSRKALKKLMRDFNPDQILIISNEEGNGIV